VPQDVAEMRMAGARGKLVERAVLLTALTESGLAAAVARAALAATVATVPVAAAAHRSRWFGR
jgi:hypothetical protein